MELNAELIPTRRSLLSRVRDWEDAASWQDFYDTYWKLIYRTACGAGLPHVEAEEVAQETLISITKAIRSFRYDPEQGSFKGWLRTTTNWRIRDHLRRRQRAEQESRHLQNELVDLAGGMDQADDPVGKNWDAEWEKNLTDTALDRLKKKVAPKQFQIFDLAVIKDWPTEKVAKTLKVNIGYVYLIKHRLSSRLKAELKNLRRDPCEANGLAGGW
jgi:RNA polymerase sigma factor (sigma-70 family)